MNSLLKYDSLELLKKIDLKELENKRIMITGASGLLGINLMSLLKESDINFKCVASFNSNPTEYFQNILNDERFEFLQGDLAEVNFEQIRKYGIFDIIFHLATYGQPNKMFAKNPDENIIKTQLNTIKLNTQVVIDLFSILKPKGKFVFISTIEIYNGLLKTPIESDIGTTTPEHDRACYIEAKRCGETICNTFKNQGYDVKIIRLCLGYGIGVRRIDKRAMNNFIFNGLNSGKIELLDNGSAIRTYCYISDVLEMMINIMLNGKKLIYNVGGREIVTIKQIANIIGEILNIPVIIPDEENKVCGASNVAKLDITRYLNEFGDKEFIDIKTGIQKTINWYKKLI